MKTDLMSLTILHFFLSLTLGMAKNRPRKKKGQSLSVRDRVFLVRRDMLRDPSLTLTQAARKRNVDPRTVQNILGSALQRDSSGQLKMRPTDNLRQILHIPGLEAGEQVPVLTKNSSERQLVGRWMAALNAAGRGDFSKIRAFPRGQIIGAVNLPTSDYEIQQILEALAEAEGPFEGLYRTIARPS